ncbi:MAG TPA: TfoX/Sxy family protein [Verrucomicrobiae bacterium]|nr:TfoX/Sxy family protein [Verrucomicrobiae bacterium]
MATEQQTVDFILDQVAGAGTMHSRKMFGEYALYCNDKVVAFICDNQLFVKPSAAAAEFEAETEMAPAYPGSKLYFRVPEDKWEDREWLQRFIRKTADALPAPKPKK